MEARALIADLRAGRAVEAADVRAFALGLGDGGVSDAQAGAFAMAVCLKGLGSAGAVALTLGMRDSGRVLSWDLPGPVVDKHSTGGIGDPVSLVLAPALASVGCYVPMISGRGLGHTGGTLDKLEAVPGLSCDVDEARLRAIVADIGCAIVAATSTVAPADRRLYAIRDVTATVESLELITASILSKKLAAGVQALVLDVKCGSGAFMHDIAAARELARALVDTANGAGCPCAARITDMNQPLVTALGNALELHEVAACLRGDLDTPLAEVVLALGADLLVLSGAAEDAGAARATLEAALRDGRAADAFARMVKALGGQGDPVEDPALLPRAPVCLPVPAPEAGCVAAMDGAALGRAVVHLGGGRLRESDRIDPAVGLSDVLRLGTGVAPGDPLAMVHAADADAAARAVADVRAAITIGEAPVAPPSLIREVVPCPAPS